MRSHSLNTFTFHNSPYFLQNLFYDSFPDADFLAAVYRSGILSIDSPVDGCVQLPVGRALFDTGALHGSYISSTFVTRYSSLFSPYIRPFSSSVTLADNRTSVLIEGVVSITLSFADDTNQIHTGSFPCYIFPMTQHDMIIGLPHILCHFGAFFLSLLNSTISSLSTSLAPFPHSFPKLPSSLQTIPSYQLPTRDPWSTDFLSIAPEEENTPVPCNFSFALHFMEMTHEQAVQEYHALFDSHVHPDFAASTKVLQLLRTKGEKVFVPSNWTGIRIEPIELQWKPGMPDSIKPKARPINPTIFESAKKEFNRLRGYFYEPSDSPVACCLVIAPKATAPFIRICGDYSPINKYIHIPHETIPQVQHELTKMLRYRVFLDVDWVNSFHQFPLAEYTSRMLSVQTPWGLFRPKFMPEGVGPASGILQKAARELFADYDEWTISIFDNLLILAHDFQDAYAKLELILDRCIERNVFLKFSKSWLGFDKANFFGYVCKHGCYELSEERKTSVTSIPFPNTLKRMQQFLGAALFFRHFIPHYSSLTAPLNDMIRSDFSMDCT